MVTFEISLEADDDLEVEDRLSNILRQIEDFEPESITVTDQKIHSEDGKLLFDFDSRNLNIKIIDMMSLSCKLKKSVMTSR